MRPLHKYVLGREVGGKQQQAGGQQPANRVDG